MVRSPLLVFLLVSAVTLPGQDRGSSGVANVRLPNETAGFEKIVQVLISAFDHIDILALGETHESKFDSDLRISLVRHPEFARKVHFIVVEFGSTAYQPVLDRYVRGEDVPLADLQQVWRNTTQTSGVWESPVYAEFFAAVREINKKLPADRRIRVLAGDPPAGSDISRRDVSAASIVKEQVLDNGGKAFLVYGIGHLYRVGGITKVLQASYPGRTLVATTLVGGRYPEYQKFEGALKSSARPVLVSLRRMPFRDFGAEEFLGRENKMLVDGVWVNAYRGSSLTLGQMADACVYSGMTSDAVGRVNSR
jgi:uncharacterized iron-regulated protein